MYLSLLFYTLKEPKVSTEKLLENLKRKCELAKQEYESLSNAIQILEKEISLLEEIKPYFSSSLTHKTNAEVAYEYLKKMNRPCSLTEIANSLKESGITSTAKNFNSNVGAILYRRNEFTRLENGMWKLTEN